MWVNKSCILLGDASFEVKKTMTKLEEPPYSAPQISVYAIVFVFYFGESLMCVCVCDCETEPRGVWSVLSSVTYNKSLLKIIHHVE